MPTVGGHGSRLALPALRAARLAGMTWVVYFPSKVIEIAGT
jgi:hypothetical protein